MTLRASALRLFVLMSGVQRCAQFVPPVDRFFPSRFLFARGIVSKYEC